MLELEPVAACWDVASGAKADRAGLQLARQIMRDLDATTLVVSKLDRISRDMRDYLHLTDEMGRIGHRLIVADNPVDPSSAVGRMMRMQLMGFAQFERDINSERTILGLQEARRKGRKLGGDRGKGPRIPADVIERILRCREMGPTWIARDLTGDGVPTASGRAQWSHKVVADVLARYPAEGFELV